MKKRYATSPREEGGHSESGSPSHGSPSHKERDKESDSDSLLSADTHSSRVSLKFALQNA